MVWTVEINAFAEKQLHKLDHAVQKRILDWLTDRVQGCKDPRHFGEPLKGGLVGLWRYRIGDYRIICELQDDQLVVVAIAIGHRREIYR